MLECSICSVAVNRSTFWTSSCVRLLTASITWLSSQAVVASRSSFSLSTSGGAQLASVTGFKSGRGGKPESAATSPLLKSRTPEDEEAELPASPDAPGRLVLRRASTYFCATGACGLLG